MSARVLVTDYAWPTLEIEQQVLAQEGAELVLAESGTEDELQGLAQDVDAILTCWAKVPASVLERASRCRIVSRYGIGLDNIDVEAATRLGIVVTNVPDYCVEEVSDHTMALLLSCARGIVRADRRTSSGVWDLASLGALPRVRGQKLGLVGFGNIARAVVPKARGFGLEVLAYSPRLRAEQTPEGVRATGDLDELLRSSDYVSLHAPLTDETRSLIDARALSRMKSSAFLINTARGALIDEAALADAIRSGEIAGAAIDVLTEEPPAPDHELLALEEVIATPHAAFSSARAIEELERRAAQHVVEALRGEVPPHVVNPSVLESPTCRLQRGSESSGAS